MTESVGGTTTVNSDTHVRMWVVQIPEEGTYDIVTDGNVNGYISPRLAFGHGSSYGWLTWVFGGLLRPWRRRARRRVVLVRPLGQGGEATRAGGAAEPRRADVE